VLAVAYSPNGQRIASGSKDKTLGLWNADTGELIGDHLMSGHTDAVTDVEFGPGGGRPPGGGRILSRSDDHTLRLWDETTVRPIGAR
jgi:WD40 repeat protein